MIFKNPENDRNPVHEAQAEDENPTFGPKDLPPQMRPVERLHRQGPRALSEIELLSILLGTGNREKSVSELARSIWMESFDRKIDAGHLKSISGIGRTKSARVLAGVELGQRLTEIKRRFRETVRIRSSQDAYEYLRPWITGLDVEHFFLVLLNLKNQPFHVEEIAKGSDSGVIVDPRWIFAKALRGKAHGILIAHNHPSGEISPSLEDDRLTRKIEEGCRLIGLNFLDHLILTELEFFSYVDPSLR